MTESSSSLEHCGHGDSGTRTPAGPSSRYAGGGASLAKLVTEVLAPAPTVAVLVLLIAWHSAPTAAEGVRWGALAALFVSVMPFLYVVRGVRRGGLTDHHVGVRQQRLVPLLVGIASMLVGLILLALWGAPRDLVALVAVVAIGLASSLLVTLVWKLSIHAAMVSGAVTILCLSSVRRSWYRLLWCRSSAGLASPFTITRLPRRLLEPYSAPP